MLFNFVLKSFWSEFKSTDEMSETTRTGMIYHFYLIDICKKLNVWCNVEELFDGQMQSCSEMQN